MVWPCLKVFWFSMNTTTGQSERKKKKRWEDNIKEWTLPAQLGQLKTEQNKMEIHLWDRMENRTE